jgi:hypothetical protein
MATATTKATLKDWCLRRLGKPVIEVNVDDDQVDDRIDEALEYFSEFHFDGVERMFLKHQLTSTDVTRAAIASDTTVAAADKITSSITADWDETNNYIPVPDTVMSVLNIFPFSDNASLNMFDIRYQMRMSDMFDFSSTSILSYSMTQEKLDFLDHMLVGEKPLRFNVHQNRLYIDMDFANDLDVGEWIIMECYRKLDPTSWTDIYNDFFLKRYATALIKQQWGQNLIKFNGVQMLGGVTMNGEMIYTQAQEEIQRLEDEMRLTYEMPIDFAVG